MGEMRPSVPTRITTPTMAEAPEFWTYVLTNFMMFGFGIVLTGLSYFAYRADRTRPSLRNATVGFGLVTIGGLVAPAYQLGFRGAYDLSGRELLVVQSVEGLFLAAGLGMLFYSVYHYSDGSRRRQVDSFDTSNDYP